MLRMGFLPKDRVLASNVVTITTFSLNYQTSRQNRRLERLMLAPGGISQVLPLVACQSTPSFMLRTSRYEGPCRGRLVAS